MQITTTTKKDGFEAKAVRSVTISKEKNATAKIKINYSEFTTGEEDAWKLTKTHKIEKITIDVFLGEKNICKNGKLKEHHHTYKTETGKKGFISGNSQIGLMPKTFDKIAKKIEQAKKELAAEVEAYKKYLKEEKQKEKEFEVALQKDLGQKKNSLFCPRCGQYKQDCECGCS
jgi:hypothetical protein